MSAIAGIMSHITARDVASHSPNGRNRSQVNKNPVDSRETTCDGTKTNTSALGRRMAAVRHVQAEVLGLLLGWQQWKAFRAAGTCGVACSSTPMQLQQASMPWLTDSFMTRSCITKGVGASWLHQPKTSI